MPIAQVSTLQESHNTIDTDSYLDDAALADMLLENAKQNGGALSGADIVFGLRNFLKMKTYPVAVKYFFSEDELADFKKKGRL